MPHDRPTIGTKWDFRNKLNESDNISQASGQGYNQIEGIDFEKTFAPVAQLEAIHLTLAFSSFKYIKLL